MPDPGDMSKYRDNRYNFHSNNPNEKAGVSPEFVHDMVLKIRTLAEKTSKAFSLKPTDPDYRSAVDVLKNCSDEVEKRLISESPKLSESGNLDKEADPKSHNSPKF